MTPKCEAVLENFGQQNIEALEKKLSSPEAIRAVPERAFTMVHTNSRTEVKITQANREACGRAIIR